MSGWRSGERHIFTKRMTEEEIDNAIVDLEKRGYVLVKKSPVSRDYGQYNDTSRKISVVVSSQWQAEMKRG